MAAQIFAKRLTPEVKARISSAQGLTLDWDKCYSQSLIHTIEGHAESLLMQLELQRNTFSSLCRPLLLPLWELTHECVLIRNGQSQLFSGQLWQLEREKRKLLH